MKVQKELKAFSRKESACSKYTDCYVKTCVESYQNQDFFVIKHALTQKYEMKQNLDMPLLQNTSSYIIFFNN